MKHFESYEKSAIKTGSQAVRQRVPVLLINGKLATALCQEYKWHPSILHNSEGRRFLYRAACVLVAYATLVAADSTFGQAWLPTSAPVGDWSSVACSADGSRLAAVEFHGAIYVSTNLGAAWRAAGVAIPCLDGTNFFWKGVASSADGTKLVAVSTGGGYCDGGRVYTSTDGGTTWTSNNVTGLPALNSPRWYSVASSSDGTRLAVAPGQGPVATTDQGEIFISANSGAVWTQTTATNGFSSIACSGDGARIFAANETSFYFSTNSGVVWGVSPAPASGFSSIACSADGSKLFAATGSLIYTSTNTGTTWTPFNAPVEKWTAIACSVEGRRLVAVSQSTNSQGGPGPIYTSSDSGATWVQANAPLLPWTSVASSADGSRLVACAFNDTGTGRIYTWAAPCVAAPANLVNWWPANGIATDIIGGNNGSLSNGVTFGVGEVGEAFSFDGVDGVVFIGAGPITPPWTAEFWVKRLDGLTNSAILLTDSNTALKLEQYNPTSLTRKVGFSAWGMEDYSFNYIAPTGVWTHLVFVGTATNTALYANGVQMDVIAASISLPRAEVGRDTLLGFGKPLRGEVDEVSLYNRALNPAEIASLYNAGSAGKCQHVCFSPPPNLVNWWPADGNAADLIGGNNGNLSNGVTFAAGEVGAAFSFDGANGVMHMGAPPIAAPWTAEFWVNRLDGLANSAVLLTDTNTALKLEQYNAANPTNLTRKVGFTAWGVADYTFNYVAPAGLWTHLVFVGTATNTALYANGTQVDSINASIALPRAELGRETIRGNNKPLRGSVDEMSLYNRALSALEIASLYNAGSAGKCRSSTLPACWISAASLVGSDLVIQFSTSAGGIYVLQTAANLTDPVWTSLPGSVTGNGNVQQLIATTAQGQLQGFFRVAIQKQ
jgi:hypothetical protein